MRKIFMSFFIVLSFFIQITFIQKAFAVEENIKDFIYVFIGAVATNDKNKLSTLTNYPLPRQSPLSDIKNPKEFVSQYEILFDQNLRSQIVNSNIDEDWDEIGHRGIAFKNGLLWLTNDGRLRSLNYQSHNEKNEHNKLIIEEKNLLHESVRDFIQPILSWNTKKYRIRVDLLSNNKFRYAAWNIDQSTSEKPNLVLENGEMQSHGSGGNHSYTFKHGNYQYICDIFYMKAGNLSNGTLIVKENNKILLSETISSDSSESEEFNLNNMSLNNGVQDNTAASNLEKLGLIARKRAYCSTSAQIIIGMEYQRYGRDGVSVTAEQAYSICMELEGVNPSQNEIRSRLGLN